MREIFFGLVLVFLLGCTSVQITNFEECLAAGNPAMESYPRQCRDDGKIFVENISEEITKDISENSHFCLEKQRGVDACITVYDPVCANVKVECITTPCDPVRETYSNSCFACQNSRVLSYNKGECKEFISE